MKEDVFQITTYVHRRFSWMVVLLSDRQLVLLLYQSSLAPWLLAVEVQGVSLVPRPSLLVEIAIVCVPPHSTGTLLPFSCRTFSTSRSFRLIQNGQTLLQ